MSWDWRARPRVRAVATARDMTQAKQFSWQLPSEIRFPIRFWSPIIISFLPDWMNKAQKLYLLDSPDPHREVLIVSKTTIIWKRTHNKIVFHLSDSNWHNI